MISRTPQETEVTIRSAKAESPITPKIGGSSDTIVDAIKIVLHRAARPLSVDDIFGRIVAEGLYGFKAAEPKSVVRSQLRRHCVNLDFATASPVKYFRLVADDKYALESVAGVRAQKSISPAERGESLPEEIIEQAYSDHLRNLRQQLKEKILEKPPAFFETLVIELLIKMGYGGSNPEQGIHTGRPGDGGIDGIIKEDRLGLGQIYIQAKRFAVDREVKRTDVQRFAGAMNKVQKGIFITTGRFAANARAFAESHEKAISLIDGDALSQFLIHYRLGVSEVKNYSVSRIDRDYFATDS